MLPIYKFNWTASNVSERKNITAVLADNDFPQHVLKQPEDDKRNI